MVLSSVSYEGDDVMGHVTLTIQAEVGPAVVLMTSCSRQSACKLEVQFF